MPISHSMSKINRHITFLLLLLLTLANCALPLKADSSTAETYSLSRKDYSDKVQGFWLSQNIANWTGLITEMDKVEEPFYTDTDWGKEDQKSIWGYYVTHSKTINFF